MIDRSRAANRRLHRQIEAESRALQVLRKELLRFDLYEQRRLIRWTCEVFGIDPTRLLP